MRFFIPKLNYDRGITILNTILKIIIFITNVVGIVHFKE